MHLGTLRSIYDSPQRYFVTIFRASITPEGLEQGWTIESLCDDALKHAGLTLADCPRAALSPTPPIFRQDGVPAEKQRRSGVRSMTVHVSATATGQELPLPIRARRSGTATGEALRRNADAAGSNLSPRRRGQSSGRW